MSNEKQTAMQQLIEWSNEYYEINKQAPSLHSLIKKSKELLALEKQQILDAHTFAHSKFGSGKIMPSEQEQQEFAEQYYSQTYNQ